MKTTSLEKQLAGCTHVNLKQLAEEHFTPAFIETTAERLLTAAGMTRNLGFQVRYEPKELEKCVVHHCARELIRDLWDFSLPAVKELIKNDGRFDLDKAVERGALEHPGDSLEENLENGQFFISKTTNNLHDRWVDSLKERYQADRRDQMAIKYMLYRSYQILICGGELEQPTILERTFASAGKETFDWTRDYPDLSREELEEIVLNSRRGLLEQADQLGIKSASKEEVLRNATTTGDLAYVLDPKTRKIVFNPNLWPLVEAEERLRLPDYHDQTKLLLKCPAKFVPSDLYPGGGMLYDLVRFRDSVFVELYLATHDRR